MSCEDFVISSYGRQGIGVVQPQSGLDFPFVAPSEDIQYLFADFYFEYDDPGFYTQHNGAAAIQHPLRLEWVYGIGCEESSSSESSAALYEPQHSADLRIIDANGVVVFDSTAAQIFRRRDWSNDYEIIEWQQRDNDVNAVCRAVVYKTWASAFSPKHFPQDIYPVNAVLDERAVYKLPKRVRTIKVRQGSVVLGAPIAEGPGVFEAGYNMQITAAAPANVAQRRNTNITFEAIPGAGIGQYTDCDTTPTEPVITINGVPGKNGDFTTEGADCIYTRRPTDRNPNNTVTPQLWNGGAKYEVGANCPSCCDCEDYVNTALYMNRVRDRYKTIGSRTHQVKLLHEENIERWIESRNCRLERPLKIVMVAQCCPSLDVVIMYCNQCQVCAENVQLNVNFSAFPNATIGEVVCGYTQVYAPSITGERYTLNGAWPSFSALLPPIDVGNSAYVKFRLKFNPGDYPYAITGTLTGTRNGQPIVEGCEDVGVTASATAVRVLNCDLEGNDAREC